MSRWLRDRAAQLFREISSQFYDVFIIGTMFVCAIVLVAVAKVESERQFPSCSPNCIQMPTEFRDVRFGVAKYVSVSHPSPKIQIRPRMCARKKLFQLIPQIRAEDEGFVQKYWRDRLLRFGADSGFHKLYCAWGTITRLEGVLSRFARSLTPLEHIDNFQRWGRTTVFIGSLESPKYLGTKLVSPCIDSGGIQ